MDELKPCPLDEARKTLWYCAQFTDGSHWENQYRRALKAICDELDRRAAPENKALTNGDHVRSMSNEELANLLDSAEGAGYNDTSIIVNENHYPADKLDWMNRPYARKPEGSETQ